MSKLSLVKRGSAYSSEIAVWAWQRRHLVTTVTCESFLFRRRRRRSTYDLCLMMTSRFALATVSCWLESSLCLNVRQLFHPPSHTWVFLDVSETPSAPCVCVCLSLLVSLRQSGLPLRLLTFPHGSAQCDCPTKGQQTGEADLIIELTNGKRDHKEVTCTLTYN